MLSNIPYCTSSGAAYLCLVSSADGRTPLSGSSLPPGTQAIIQKGSGYAYQPSGAIMPMGWGWIKINLNQYDSNTLGGLLVTAWCSGSSLTSAYVQAEYNIVASDLNEWQVNPNYIYTATLSGSQQALSIYSGSMSNLTFYNSYSGSQNALRSTVMNATISPSMSGSMLGWAISGSQAGILSEYSVLSAASLSGSIQALNQYSGSEAQLIYYNSYSGSQNAIINEYTQFISAAYSGSSYWNDPNDITVAQVWQSNLASGTLNPLIYNQSYSGAQSAIKSQYANLITASYSGSVMSVSSYPTTATISTAVLNSTVETSGPITLKGVLEATLAVLAGPAAVSGPYVLYYDPSQQYVRVLGLTDYSGSRSQVVLNL